MKQLDVFDVLTSTNEMFGMYADDTGGAMIISETRFVHHYAERLHISKEQSESLMRKLVHYGYMTKRAFDGIIYLYEEQKLYDRISELYDLMEA